MKSLGYTLRLYRHQTNVKSQSFVTSYVHDNTVSGCMRKRVRRMGEFDVLRWVRLGHLKVHKAM